MPPKPKQGSVGRALMKRHQQQKAAHGQLGAKELQEKTKLVSVLDSTSLDDFLSTALMAQRDFTATKERDMILLDTKGASTTLSMSRQRKIQAKIESLKVPRRPVWSQGISAAELDRMEKDAFLAWRRNIAELEEANDGQAKVTPFEKNLEVWRQLWRVLERSAVVMQIVDARNPLFYYSEDLHVYAGMELRPARRCVVLVNKADFLTIEQRRAWARYFKSRGWACVFFSARAEQAKLTEAARRERDEAILRENRENRDEADGEGEEETESDEEEEEEGEEDSASEEEAGAEEEVEEEGVGEGQAGREGEDGEEGRLLTRDELLAQLRAIGAGQESERDGHRVTVGMVGFPNVGKSSVINVLLGVTSLDHDKGRVAISSTPGKTKHFQTLVLDEHLMLCDCPGLVFPSFVSTTAQMVTNGVLPINQLRDHMGPVEEICRRLPAAITRGFYGVPALPAALSFGGVPLNEDGELVHESADNFLVALCDARGYTSQGSGVPDVNRAARMVLKDYVEGRLFFNHPPPGMADEDEGRYYTQTLETLAHAPKLAARVKCEGLDAVEEGEGEEEDEDEDGVEGIEGSMNATSLGEGGSSTGAPRPRPAKKWGKKGKKLRNKTPYADPAEGDVEGSATWQYAKAKGAWKGEGGFTRVKMPHWDGKVADDGTTIGRRRRPARPAGP